MNCCKALRHWHAGTALFVLLFCVASDASAAGYITVRYGGDSTYGSSMNVAGGDINNDSSIDVVAKYGTGKITWLRNCGDSLSWWGTNCAFHETTIATGGCGYTLFVADMDGDTDLDVVACGNHPTGGYATPSWYENSSNGASWTKHMIYDSGTDTPLWVEPADIDADGDMDVAIGMSQEILWVEMNSGSVVGSATLGTQACGGSWCAHPAQLDGDAELEIVGTWYY